MKKTIILILGVFLLVALIGCNKKKEGGKNKADSGSEKTFTIKLSMVFAPEEELTKQIIGATDRIRERTNGTVDIQVFPSGVLPAYKDNLEQVVSGSYWIAVEDPSYVGDYVPDFAALVGPSLYTSYDEYEAMVRTPYVKDLEKQAEAKGIKILALDYIFGFRHVVLNKTIKTPADLKGSKIRVPKSQLFIETLKAMGANAAPIPFSETYTAIQQGVVDGFEGSINTLYANKMYEVTKDMSLTNHFIGTGGVYISTKVWDEFSANQQEIVQEEFTKGASMNNKRLRELDEEYLVKLKDLGVKFHEVDSEAFSKATAPVYDMFPKWSKGIYDTLQDELKKVRAKL